MYIDIQKPVHISHFAHVSEQNTFFFKFEICNKTLQHLLVITPHFRGYRRRRHFHGGRTQQHLHQDGREDDLIQLRPAGGHLQPGQLRLRPDGGEDLLPRRELPTDQQHEV